MTRTAAAAAPGPEQPAGYPNEFYMMVRPIPGSAADALDLGPRAEAVIESGLKEVNDALEDKGSAWKLVAEEGSDRVVVPVKVIHPPIPGLPATALHPPGPAKQADLGDLIQELDRLSIPVEFVGDPHIYRFPGHKPTLAGHTFSSHVGSALPGVRLRRRPVAVVAGPPPRRSRDSHPERRPVVALLDTQVEPHDWLGPADTKLGGDGFWVDATALGWKPGPRLLVPGHSGSTPPADTRPLGVYEGHGTFCAGLVRQLAPDAQVLAVHVARDDDRHVYGDHVLNALGWLGRKPAGSWPALAAGDVVCVPSGFRPGPVQDREYLDLLRRVLDRLAGAGVTVVAAAGNDGSAEPVFPAAFAVSTELADRIDRVVSVGAYNSDGRTPAHFSNHGSWVTRWEIGSNVVSTFPAVDAARTPELVDEPGRADPPGFPARTSTDPDDLTRRKPAGDEPPAWEETDVQLTGGFASWSGTSFAAAIHAGRLVQRGVRPEPEAMAATHAVS